MVKWALARKNVEEDLILLLFTPVLWYFHSIGFGPAMHNTNHARIQPTDILHDCVLFLLSLWFSSVLFSFIIFYMLVFWDYLSCSCKETW